MVLKSCIHLVVIEDSQWDTEILDAVLGQIDRNFSVKNFKCGEKAEAYFLAEDIPIPDIIILDLGLPRVDGQELLKIIRASKNLTSVPVYISSGIPDAFETVQAVGDGATGILEKPPKADRLIEIIKEVGL